MRHVNKVLLVVIVFVAVPLLYFAAYMSSMTAVITTKGITYEGPRSQGFIVFRPEYSFSGLTAEVFFLPANWLDHKIRPEFWQTSYEPEDETQTSADVVMDAAWNP
jgi:hypothetical protein